MAHMASKFSKILPESSEKGNKKKENIRRKKCQAEKCKGNKSQKHCASCSKVVHSKCTGKFMKG